MAVVWRFCDGKPGHERQSAGLIQALAALGSFTVIEVDVRDSGGALRQWLLASFPQSGPPPDLIVGAGSRCQLPMLAARRSHGGRIVYLMKPKFPSSWFDVCFIPRHDKPRAGPHVIVTDGVLNDIVRSKRHAADRGLILVGGPSPHYRWDDRALIAQIETLLAASPNVRWQIGNSRRTPPRTTDALRELVNERIEFTDCRTVNTEWLKQQLSIADQVWVSQDSVSMTFEAITSGARVGLLEVPVEKQDRITSIADDLTSRGWVTRYSAWQPGQPLTASPPLDEAARAAKLLIERFPVLVG